MLARRGDCRRSQISQDLGVSVGIRRQVVVAAYNDVQGAGKKVRYG
jgi:hypothetical protein